MRKSYPQTAPVVNNDGEGTDWHRGGHDVPDWAIAAFIAGLGLVLLLVVLAMGLVSYGTNSGGWPGTDTGSWAPPSTYGPPDANRTVPDVGLRPSPALRSLPGVP